MTLAYILIGKLYPGYGEMKKLFVFIILLFIAQPVMAQKIDTMELVKQIQAKTEKLYSNIESIVYTGRSKAYVYFGWGVLGMNMVPLLEEYYFDGVWTAPDSIRTIVKAYRRVEPDDSLRNLKLEFPPPNPVEFSYNSTLNNMEMDMDSIETEDGKKEFPIPISPFAPGADSLYNYKLVSEIGINYRTIYEIKVEPKKSDIPGVIGVFQIDPLEKDVVGGNYTFNEAAHFLKTAMDTDGDTPWWMKRFVNPEEDYKVASKNALVNEIYWFPQSQQVDMIIKLMGMNIKFTREVEFTSYIINTPPEPEIMELENKPVVFEIDTAMEERVFEDLEFKHKLTSEEEKELLSSIEDKFKSMALSNDIFDSEAVARNALEMSLGQKSGKYFEFFKDAGRDMFLYNRVEGFRVFHNIGFTNFPINDAYMSVTGGYGFEDERFKVESSALYFFDKKKKWFMEGNIYDKITYEEGRSTISNLKNTFSSLFLKADYRDYYYTQGGRLSLGYKFNDNSAFKLTGISQQEESALNNTRFSFVRWDDYYRPNPDIMEGQFNGLQASFLLKNHLADLNITAQYTDKENFKSDFEYSFIKSNLELKYNPNHSHNFVFTLSGAYSDGLLSPQRWFDFGGKTFGEYYGNLRGIGYKAFTGDRMAYGLLEYSLMDSYLLDVEDIDTRWDNWRHAGKITFWTGIGWSDLSEKNRALAAGRLIPAYTTNGTYNEFGISIGDRFNMFRFDFVHHNDSTKEILFSFNIFR